MPEKPKNEKDEKNKAEKSFGNTPETGDEDSWSRAQKEQSYYYDDAHGYEIYNPDEDDEDDEDEEDD